MAADSPSTAPRHIVLIGNAASSLLNFRLPLIRDLVAAGWQVTALAPDWAPGQLAQLQREGAQGTPYPLARTGLNPVHDLCTFVALCRALRRIRPQAVLTITVKPNVWGMLAAAWVGVPRRVAMVTGLGFAFTEMGGDGRSRYRHFVAWVLARLYRLAFGVAHAVVVQNPDDGAFLRERIGVVPPKVVVGGGTGVPLEEWPLHPPHKEPITFTLVARLLREKGVLEFLAAARQIKADFPSVRFWLLGPLDENPGGLREDDLRPWLADGTVEWPGAVDVKPWLAQTSVFVLPSYREGVPRSTQEAMAMGRPVITTDVPGCRETVIDGLNGWLVPPRDVAALVRAMRRFIEQPALIERMGRESRRLAEERFDVRRSNARLLSLVTSV